MAINWAYIVEYMDRNCRLLQRERFLFPADARERREQLLRAGFWGVRLRQQRVRAGGPPTNSAPGIYLDGRPIAGQEFTIKRDGYWRK